MGKPNWACTRCGMHSSRKESVRRHIRNLHQGNAYVIPVLEYIAGMQLGKYRVQYQPTYRKHTDYQGQIDRMVHSFEDEISRALARKMVENGTANFSRTLPQQAPRTQQPAQTNYYYPAQQVPSSQLPPQQAPRTQQPAQTNYYYPPRFDPVNYYPLPAQSERKTIKHNIDNQFKVRSDTRYPRDPVDPVL